MTRHDLATYFKNVILQLEGGYGNNPNDTGKATKYGVTLATLQGYRKNPSLTEQDVKKLTEQEAFLIIRDYVIKDYMLDYPLLTAFQILDWNWGAGPCTGLTVAKGFADTALGSRDINNSLVPMLLTALKANHYRTSGYYIRSDSQKSSPAGNSIFYKGWMKKNMQAGVRNFSGLNINADYFLKHYPFSVKDDAL